MDADVKATGLKQLQGLIWQGGFESGELKAHVYDDVPPALRVECRGQGRADLFVRERAGSEAVFGHTIAGDLLPQFRGIYDTTTGPKKEADSYRKIAADFKLATSEILFLSDMVAELDAGATRRIWSRRIVIRPGNAQGQTSDGPDHRTIISFAELGPC